ncbi:MAG: hypothetical protein HZB24_03215 [Desulfobacterales bacterium]|nr:hypothetical protein [Desulfobacterales bacterium]
MDVIARNLRRYLETEKLLNAFFAALDYCWPQCIRGAMQRNGNRPVAACCQNKYYSLCDLEHPAFERLRAERETLFGKPADHVWENPVSPCPYHNPGKGCLLDTHKSPVCIAFLCREAIEFLRSRYGIYRYDYLGAYYALEWILTGDFSYEQYLEFRESILAMIAIVKNKEAAQISVATG